MRDRNLVVTANRMPQFCGPIPTMPSSVPLRVKTCLAATLLADSEFKQVDTMDLIWLARERKRVHVSDRASAIAALKGVR